MKRRRPRRRSPLPFLLLAVVVVGCAFAAAVAAVVPMEADSPGGQDQAFPAPTLEEAERDKQGGGWQFPRPIEIIKCKEGNKEYMKERPARKPYGRIVKMCEFSLEAVAEFGDDDARAVWRLAKRAARDFLRVSWINTAIVTAAKTDRPYMAVIVYGKY